jgi:hypothetical protein
MITLLLGILLGLCLAQSKKAEQMVMDFRKGLKEGWDK